MTISRHSLLRTLLVAIATAPTAFGCNGMVTIDTASDATGEPTAGSSGQAGTSSGGSSGAGAGGATPGGSAGVGGGAAGTTGAQVPCDNPTPVLVDGQPTGFVTCANGALTRPEARACVNHRQPMGACTGPSPFPSSCTTNADCKDGPYDVCLSGYGSCDCQKGCVQDSDCAADELCQCGEQIGLCIKATCHTDADCPEGGCALVEVGTPGCTTQAFMCQRLADACASDQQCQGQAASACHVSAPGELRKCDPMQCAIGRPLVVAEQVLRAALVRDGAWG